MVLAQVFQLDSSGWGSNVFMAIFALLCILIIAISFRTIVKSIFLQIKGKADRTVWYWIGFSFLIWFVLISTAVKAMLAARAGVPGSGLLGSAPSALEGASGRVKPRPGFWLAISLIAAPLFIWVIVRAIALEDPLRLAVLGDKIELLYRLPWRDNSIHYSNIQDVKLERHDYLEKGIRPAHFYLLVIRHDGRTTSIHCSQRPWYEDQMQAAYQTIRRHLAEARDL